MVPGEGTQIAPLQEVKGKKCRVVTKAEKYAHCVLQDVTSLSSTGEKFEFELPYGTTVGHLIATVGRHLNCDPDTFDLVLHKESGEQVVIANADEELKDVGFEFSYSHIIQNHVMIFNKGFVQSGQCKKSYKKSFTSQRLSKSSVVTDGSGDASATYVPPPAPPPYTTGQTEFFFNYSYSNAVIKPETGFVGLVNQAMTCYLNSLLQTLYMTPEFRNALYRWEFDGSEEEGTKSIPFQLQKLFLQLQTSKKPAVGTTDLTTSFGWDSSEAWQQHDVQELCRVMFDALEQKFKNTEQAELISTLYEGKLKDYVKCLECGCESAREDTFLDVPLVVRPFGSSEAYGSVEEALHAFVAPEILQDCNQYFCERCSKKCDAHKGLKFTKFPYLLTLQLKRFDFDPITMHRIKLNDKVTFPEILNLNDFIKEEKVEDTCNDGDTTDSGSAVDDDGLCYAVNKTEVDHSPEAGLESMDHIDDDEGIDVGVHALSQCGNSQEISNSEEISTNEKNLRKSMEKGPYMYELFSIMVHSGSANGGHYYAYIKSFKDGEWYCFNDAQVTRITYDDIQKTYGGGPPRGYYSSAYSSSINAYMLMYRQIDKIKNAEFISTEAFPDHIKLLLQNMVEQEERERQQRELDRYMCKIKLFCQHPVQRRMIEMKLKVHRDCTLAEATATARTIMGLENTVPLDCCRLVKYDDFHDSLECSFDGADDEPIGELLGGVKSSYKFDLLLEIKQPHEEFQEYKLGGTTVKIHVVDLEREEVAASPITLRSHLSETVAGFKSQVAKALGVTVNLLRMVVEMYNNEIKPIENSSATLKSIGFGKSNKVFVEFRDEEDGKRNFSDSKFASTLDRHFHTVCIYVSLPRVDKIILEKLRIQENDAEREDSQSDEESSEDENRTAAVFHTFSEVKELCPWKQLEKESRVKRIVFRRGQKVAYSASSNNQKKKAYPVIIADDSSQDCDEGLGDSEIGDSCSTSGYQNCQAVNSDQSEDSSLTDSERTLVGDELSPHNNSPEIIGNEMEIDGEPSHVLSPDVSRPDSDSAHSSSDSNFQVDEQTDDLSNPSSPEDNAKDSKCCAQLECLQNSACHNNSDFSQIVIKRYFRAWPYTDYETGEKMLRVYVDKRITLEVLKKELEPFVGVGAECFKIYRLYSNNQEFECTRPTENLVTYTDETKLIVKLGRALRKGEYKVKIYHLCINDSEPSKPLIDWVFVKGMTVLQAKKEILPEIKESCGLDIPLNRCRLRKKSWKNPGTIFLDHQQFDKDIPVNTNWEVFLEVLSDAEPVTSVEQLAVFVKRWHPSTYTLDKFQEIVIAPPTIESLKSKISEISGIPKEYVEFAKGTGAFPCDVSLLSIHNELDWHSCSQTINTWILTLADDGHVVYYRDSQEELKQLTEEEKREITNKENARSNKIHKTSFSPRKEKALKIYTLDSTPCKSTTSCSASNEANSAKLTVPDLD